MKALFYSGTRYGTLFWDQDQKIISYIHENDARFHAEYFSKLFIHFGVKVKYEKSMPAKVEKAFTQEKEFEEDK